MEELDAAFAALGADPRCAASSSPARARRRSWPAPTSASWRRRRPVDGKERSIRGQRVLDRIENLGKPVIAAVNGFALGGGCELALACHVRIASENARLGTPEVKLGIMCGYGGTQRLPRLVGKGRALEMLLTGEMVDAQEALRIGLVNRVVPQEKLLAEAEALLRKMLANGPVSLRFTLEAVNAGLEMPLDGGAVPGGHALRPDLHDRGHEGRDEGLPREAPREVPGQVKAPQASAPRRPSARAGCASRPAARAFNARVVDGLLAARAEALRGDGRRRRGRRPRSRCRAPSSCRSRRAAAASSGRFDAVVALGAVIRGETDHYEHIAREAAAGLAAVALRDGRAGRLRRAHGGGRGPGAGALGARPGQQGRGGGARGGRDGHVLRRLGRSACRAGAAAERERAETAPRRAAC